MERLRNEMFGFYRPRMLHVADPSEPPETARVRGEIEAAMNRLADAHPEWPPALLKAHLHQEIAERFQPVIFRHTPFYFEMDLRPAENWGTPHPQTAGSWLLRRQAHLWQATPETGLIESLDLSHGVGLWQGPKYGFDADHHCLGYSHLLQVGVQGLLTEIAARRSRPHTPEQAVQLEAMERSCRAVLRIAQRFGEEASRLLASESDPQCRRFLSMIASTAPHVPAEPPRTFYEGLAALWFLREVAASLESVGISVVGHPDRQLVALYRADLAEGRITEGEARDLVARWMLPTDVKFHVDDRPSETSTCIELGGCDADGHPVWNELTRLFIEVHRAHKLIHPKLNCRYSANSSQAYLEMISEAILAGHNHFALLNDDVLIPACVRAGRAERDARLYVNGGCQETIVEGMEHSAGAYYYFNMPRVLDLHLCPQSQKAQAPEQARAALPEPMGEPDSFEAFYESVMAALDNAIGWGARWRASVGVQWREVNPCPFFSAALRDCIEKGLDYTAGGGRYNPSNICLVGFGTLINALYAVRRAVYEAKWLSLSELRQCLANNWAGHEALRERMLHLPRYGHGHAEVDTLAARVSQDLAAHIRSLPNERGGRFNASLFVYSLFQRFGQQVGATPDGRRAGEMLSMGMSPDRVMAPSSPTDIARTISRLDMRDHAGNAVLDIQLPLGGAIDASRMSAWMRAFAQAGCPTLQPNCVSVRELRDAQSHPEAHRDLVVRLYGLSVHFVTLTADVQDEFIERTLYAQV